MLLDISMSKLDVHICISSLNMVVVKFVRLPNPLASQVRRAPCQGSKDEHLLLPLSDAPVEPSLPHPEHLAFLAHKYWPVVEGRHWKF